MLFVPPGCPTGLAEGGVTVERARKGRQFGASVGGDLSKCALQLGPIGRVASGEDVDVGEVAPSGVSAAALQRGDDLSAYTMGNG